METLLIFLAIAAIQMIAAYSKQKKEAAKREANKYNPPPEATEPIPDPFRNLREYVGIPDKDEEDDHLLEKEIKHRPSLELELESDLKPVQRATQKAAQKPIQAHPVSYADTPLKAGNNSQLSTINYQLDIKNPAQGILWAAILHEPRYRVKWKQR
ncbi:MAG: hypothetical protein LBC75_03405 [Fibromonadaceae bacterium]|jgi:hypothetical protein|nr:hypothetical protein [Fibromonadaceae bacterium]